MTAGLQPFLQVRESLNHHHSTSETLPPGSSGSLPLRDHQHHEQQQQQIRSINQHNATAPSATGGITMYRPADESSSGDGEARRSSPAANRSCSLSLSSASRIQSYLQRPYASSTGT
ncbi:Os11g0531800 [Oryza sativa Japonica Group]|uniref:Os11g0531800 protein n=2 Tax=Oryza sativa subsp. japonica TaxID=39947 RepID=Q0ISE0_ORYSJ|nr:hypothetical protein EE612_055915 [Oryza sativa]BAF28375.1 Os11g0531800 [Oryza sativa Japonica Group]BAT14287.1 Os11g0531800 [Oryza sativa Japonica Group]|eukprot:NP_001068012.1 Os11g0531800 [Oryza sativa Japonica Group]